MSEENKDSKDVGHMCLTIKPGIKYSIGDNILIMGMARKGRASRIRISAPKSLPIRMIDEGKDEPEKS